VWIRTYGRFFKKGRVLAKEKLYIKIKKWIM